MSPAPPPFRLSRNRQFYLFCRPEARRALRLYRILRSLQQQLARRGSGRLMLRHDPASSTISIDFIDPALGLKRQVTIRRQLFKTVPFGRKLWKLYQELEKQLAA